MLETEDLKSTYYLRNKSASEIEKSTSVGDSDNSNYR